MAKATTRSSHLIVAFLAVVVPIFIVFSVPGVGLLVDRQLSADRADLASRFGNLVARSASALKRHDAAADPVLARDLILPLMSDRAFVCAELQLPVSGEATVKLPTEKGVRWP